MPIKLRAALARRLVLAAALLTAAPQAHAAARAKPAAAAVDPVLRLDGVLDSLRLAHDVPGIAAAVIERGQVVAIGAAGVTVAGAGRRLTVDDPMHIGSCTKSMLALALARLVERHKLEWSLTIADVFPELMSDMLPVYRRVRLDQLLTHRAQIPAFERVSNDTLAEFNALEPDPVQTRVAFARYMLDEPPEHDPSQPYDYSNAGYTLAAAMAERSTGKTWERLVRELVFEPLAMTHAGFGWPSDARRDAPRGHRCTDSTGVVPEPLKNRYQLGAVLGPGGDVNASISDLARYMVFELDGALGRASDPPLAAATWRSLTNDPDGDSPGYAMGWQVLPGDSARTILFHDGTAGTFYTRMLIEPAHDRAVVIETNVGPPCGHDVCEQAVGAVLTWVRQMGR